MVPIYSLYIGVTFIYLFIFISIKLYYFKKKRIKFLLLLWLQGALAYGCTNLVVNWVMHFEKTYDDLFND